jgi:hypothetical protein
VELGEWRAPKYTLVYGQMIFDKVPRLISGVRTASAVGLRKLYIHMQKNEVGSLSFAICQK